MALPSDNPAVQDFAAATNADLSVPCLIQDQNRDAVDLTSATLAMDIKETIDGAAILSLSSGSTTGNGSSLNITSASEGAFTIDVKKADFAALSFGTASAIAGFYDITRTLSGETIRLVKGQITISKGVTL